MKLRRAFVYIMSNIRCTTFYIGVTNDLERRVKEHKSGLGSEFTTKYNLKKLVYLEIVSDIDTAIKREKQLKRWHREWKINLIRQLNPEFKDLASEWNCLASDPETSSG
jgi:putative endonuclease